MSAEQKDENFSLQHIFLAQNDYNAIKYECSFGLHFYNVRKVTKQNMCVEDLKNSHRILKKRLFPKPSGKLSANQIKTSLKFDASRLSELLVQWWNI